jgi:CBS domain-containing protein
MKIKDRFEFKNKAALVTVKPDTSAFEAVNIISEKNYGACIVVDDDYRPVGIVTERDFMRRLLGKQLDPKKTKVSQIMTSNLKFAKLDDDIVDWLRQMSNERFRHVPVVDDNGKLINILSQGDLVSYTWPELLKKTKDETIGFILLRYQPFLILSSIVVYALAMTLFHKYFK